jgi:hypothetical protein
MIGGDTLLAKALNGIYYKGNIIRGVVNIRMMDKGFKPLVSVVYPQFSAPAKNALALRPTGRSL